MLADRGHGCPEDGIASGDDLAQRGRFLAVGPISSQVDYHVLDRLASTATRLTEVDPPLGSERIPRVCGEHRVKLLRVQKPRQCSEPGQDVTGREHRRERAADPLLDSQQCVDLVTVPDLPAPQPAGPKSAAGTACPLAVDSLADDLVKAVDTAGAGRARQPDVGHEDDVLREPATLARLARPHVELGLDLLSEPGSIALRVCGVLALLRLDHDVPVPGARAEPCRCRPVHRTLVGGLPAAVWT